MMDSSSFFLVTLVASMSLFSGSAFLTQQSPHQQRTATRMIPDELQELEKARANFEYLMKTEGLLKDDAILPLPHKKEEYKPRPLTESSRQRRQFEMKLLASLEDSDEAVEELVALWMLERGEEAFGALKQMEQVCSPGLVEEENMLRGLLDEFGVHWAEPVSRLAALLYFKGNSAESMQWCEVALAVKPWHFEAVHTHVLNALRENDLPTAVRWQRKALPPLNRDTNNKARRAWAKRAVSDARESMAKAEAVAEEMKRGKNAIMKESEIWQ